MPRKKKTAVEEEIQNQPEVKEETAVVEDEKGAETTDVKDVKESAPEKTEKPKRKRKAKVEIDEVTRDTRALLKGARSNCTILRGMIERVDIAENAPSPETSVYAIVHYNNFKVMIPAVAMGIRDVPDELPPQEKASKYKRFLNTMLGANIDYVVTHVSEGENIAAGNREVAQNILKKKGFENKYRNTGMSYMEYAMEKKEPVEADIVAVSGSQIRLSVFGVEGKVLAKEASWRFTSNLSEKFYPGETVKIIVKEIRKNEENGEITVIGSIRETVDNPQVNNIADYSRNATCLGRVTGAIDRGYFLTIGDDKTGIEAFCDLVHGGITPQINDIVSCQLTNIDYETGAAKAKITRIIRRSNPGQF